jgi:hypothetical protein
MFDIHIRLDDKPGELGRFGEAMGAAGISIEGGGVFTTGRDGQAHFLVENGEKASRAAQVAGLEVVAIREVLVRRLRQDEPGQLGAIGKQLGEAGVNIVTMYSDHANRLILVTDDSDRARAVTEEWRPDCDREGPRSA